MRPGFHLVHKPVGATSFSLVRELMDAIAARGLSKQLPVCHGGALDPFAEGLLLLLVGQATRLMDLVHAAPKRYLATVGWGVETDNGDPTGRVVFRGAPDALEPALLDVALARFIGWSAQVPPPTSNKRIDGERAYLKAQRGESFELPPSRVLLCQARWVSHTLPAQSTLELECGGGFYVRSLARDLGRALGCGAHLSTLRRTAIGPWSDPPAEDHPWIHGRGLLPWLPVRALDEGEVRALEQGRAIEAGRVAAPDWPLPAGFDPPRAPIRAFDGEALVALLEPRDGRLAATMTLRGGL